MMPRTLFLLLALAACGEPTTSDGLGTVEFAYSGAVSGRFSARGGTTLDAGGNAVAAVRPRDGSSPALVLAAQRRADGETQTLSLSIPLGVGTYACAAGQYGCTVDAALTLAVLENGSRVRRDFLSTAGTVTVQSVSADNVRGTFSFTLVDAAPQFEAGGAEVQVTSGRFDAPLVDAPCGFGCTR